MARYETDEELHRETVRRGYNVPATELGAMAFELGLHAPYGEGDLKEILQRLEEKGTHAQPPPTALEVAWKKAELASEREYNWEKDNAHYLRQHYFGIPTPPFENMAEADDWILPQAREKGEGVLLGRLEYIGRNDILRQVEVYEGSPLEKLWRSVKAIGRTTILGRGSCRDHRLLAFILTGERIPIPLYSWRSIPGREYTITIRSPDVPIKFVNALVRALREATFESKRPSTQSPENVERAYHLLRFASFRKRDKTWEDCRREWNRQYPHWAFTDQDAVRMAYERARKAHWF